jgi:hypothetical protein
LYADSLIRFLEPLTLRGGNPFLWGFWGAGTQGIIAGCTEVPLLLSQEDLSVPFLDSLLILAKEAVREATGKGLLRKEKGGEMRRKQSTERRGVM